MKIDPSLLNNRSGENSRPEPEVPPVVLGALALLSLLFMVGIGYLWITNGRLGIKAIYPDQLAPLQIAVAAYQGPLWEMEKKRDQVKDLLKQQGLALGDPITVYATSPMHLRPLEVKNEVGYILALGMVRSQSFQDVSIKRISPGRRLVVAVKGHGDFTGLKAYKAAQRFLADKGLKPGEGERYEVKRMDDRGRRWTEHWIPVQ